MMLTAADAGCWIDGHWGQYASARLVTLANDYGRPQDDLYLFAAAHLQSMGPNGGPPILDNEYEALLDGIDEVEQWMTNNVAPDGYSFGWHDGEWFLWSHEDWEETV